MKKILLTILLFSFITLIIAEEEPNSMRSIASGGVFRGIWEDVYDPINLSSINKFYFFTNFNDFKIDYNELLGDIPEKYETRFFQELPLGMAFKNPYLKKLRHSFFIRFRMNKSLPKDPNSGDFEEYSTQYEDVTGDNIYDIKTVTHLKTSNYDKDDKVLDFIWNNNYKLNNFDLGFKYSSFTSKQLLDYSLAPDRLGEFDFGGYGYIFGFVPGDKQKEISKEMYEINADNYYFKYSEKGDFNTIIETQTKKFQFSIQKDNGFIIDNSLLRFDFGMDFQKAFSNDTNDKYSASYEEIVIPDTLINNGNITETYKNNIFIKKNNYYLSTNLKKNISESFNNKKGFWELFFNIGYVNGYKKEVVEDHFISEEKTDSLNSVEYTLVESKDNYESVSEKGDNSGIDLNAHFLLNLPLNRYSMFGIGSYYSYSNIGGTYDYVSELNNIHSYQEGSQIDAANEYISTETSYLSADKQNIKTISELKIPVAIELKIKDEDISQNDGFGLRNFIFRLGSTFLYYVAKTENTYDIKESQPDLIITEFGDGNITEDHDSDNLLTSSKHFTKRVKTAKVFSAGIAYKHSENINIELGGYYNYDTKDYLAGISFVISK